MLWSNKVRVRLSFGSYGRQSRPAVIVQTHTQLLPEETYRQERVVLWCIPSMMGYIFFFYLRLPSLC